MVILDIFWAFFCILSPFFLQVRFSGAAKNHCADCVMTGEAIPDNGFTITCVDSKFHKNTCETLVSGWLAFAGARNAHNDVECCLFISNNHGIRLLTERKCKERND